TRWPRDWSSDVCSSDLAQKRCHRHARPLELADRGLDAPDDVTLGDEGRSAVGQARHENVVAGSRRERGDLGATEAVERAALPNRSEERRVGEGGGGEWG